MIFQIFVVSICSYGQFEYYISEEESKTSSNIPNSSDYIPDSNTPIKYIRVNIHYMLRSPNHPDYPGNFTKTNDGNSNSNYTGYDYAEQLIKTANYRLSTNSQMHLPPNNSTNVIARKYRYVLNGVFFHENNNYYFYPSIPNGTYGENKGECINVFFNNSNGTVGGGHANMDGYRWVEIKGAWEKYLGDIGNGRGIETGLWVNAQTLNHEIGHNFSLKHTLLTGNGACANEDDYCSDTPSRNEIINNYSYDPCCDAWDENIICSNNLMDYSGLDAITPEQLGRVHWTIENEIQEYKSCYFSNSTVNITSFTDNKSYIGENVYIPVGTSININNGNAMYINAEIFEIVGTIEVGANSMLIVNTLPKCN